MTSDDPVVHELAANNPVSSTASADAHDRARADELRQHIMRTPVRSGRRSRLRISAVVPAVSVLIVLAVVAVVLRSGNAAHNPAGTAGHVRIVLRAEPTTQIPHITAAVIDREVGLLRERLSGITPQATVTRLGSSQIAITTASSASGMRARILERLRPASLSIYDWEADVLLPDGKAVASQLRNGLPQALRISQGTADSPGAAGSGALSLYRAVRLAAKQPPVSATSDQRPQSLASEIRVLPVRRRRQPRLRGSGRLTDALLPRRACQHSERAPRHEGRRSQANRPHHAEGSRGNCRAPSIRARLADPPDRLPQLVEPVLRASR